MFTSKLKNTGIKKVAFNLDMVGNYCLEKIIPSFDKLDKSIYVLNPYGDKVVISSPSSILSSGSDLLINLSFNSYQGTDGAEVLYLKDDAKSKKIADHLAKEYSKAFSGGITVKAIDVKEKGGYALQPYKSMPYKIIFTPYCLSNDEGYIYHEVLNRFMVMWLGLV